MPEETKPDVLEFNDVEEVQHFIKKTVREFLIDSSLIKDPNMVAGSVAASTTKKWYDPSVTEWLKVGPYRFRFQHVPMALRKIAEAQLNELALNDPNKPVPQTFIQEGKEPMIGDKNPAYIEALKQYRQHWEIVENEYHLKVCILHGIEMHEDTPIPEFDEWVAPWEERYKLTTGNDLRDTMEHLVLNLPALKEIMFKEYEILKHPQLKLFFEQFMLGQRDPNFEPIQRGVGIDMFRCDKE